MSYARKYGAMGRVFHNVCSSLKHAERYKGFSVLAGEELLNAVRQFQLPGASTARRATDWAKLLKDNYPIDYWRFNKQHPSWDIARQSKAEALITRINGQEEMVFLTFEGVRMKVSNLSLAIEYLRKTIPREAWDYIPCGNTARKALKSGKCVYTYGENSAIIERVRNGNS